MRPSARRSMVSVRPPSQGRQRTSAPLWPATQTSAGPVPLSAFMGLDGAKAVLQAVPLKKWMLFVPELTA
ncbi:hypothetical protein MXAN_3907 [Myxococcus xanthus DK 1622]|uniref:Uncharacterized protein n=1 Tax=Myxococcus xanthus (strain DK1622) TaxID=246197 RepID=Q1D5I6_MYXXD|nr:hypothetical protein MXAN_3907 [Myxococcus xanthus DK 1622]